MAVSHENSTESNTLTGPIRHTNVSAIERVTAVVTAPAFPNCENRDKSNDQQLDRFGAKVEIRCRYLRMVAATYLQAHSICS